MVWSTQDRQGCRGFSFEPLLSSRGKTMTSAFHGIFNMKKRTHECTNICINHWTTYSILFECPTRNDLYGGESKQEEL